MSNSTNVVSGGTSVSIEEQISIMSEKEVVKIPKWVLTLVGSLVAVVFAGLLTWLTSMNVAIQANAVDIASIKADVQNQVKSTDEVKEALSRMNTKLDRLLEKLNGN